jgi:hypothetical protein
MNPGTDSKVKRFSTCSEGRLVKKKTGLVGPAFPASSGCGYIAHGATATSCVASHKSLIPPKKTARGLATKSAR